jgi:hypothetical protein
MLGKFQTASRWVIVLYLLLALGGLVLIAGHALSAIPAVLVEGQFEQMPVLMLLVGVTGGFMALIGWILSDSANKARWVHPRRPRHDEQSDDMSDAAGIVPRDPWQG